MKLSEKLKEYRRKFDLSQEQLGEKLNVSRQVITKWENEGGMPEITNLKLVAELFGVSIDYLLDDGKAIEYPIMREKYDLGDKKNNYSNRYDFAVNYLKENYDSKGEIYVLTEVEHGERGLLEKFFSFLTIKVSDISYLTQWLKDMAIWFLVDKKEQKLLVKVTKDYIETRELSQLIDTDKFTFEKSKFKKISKI